jgi:16S rRNA (adenine1518-N6/adenine1519-N6)-dimethyltransferase
VIELLGAAEIRDLAERLKLKPTKKLGQNFVIDGNTCRKIVKLANAEKSDIALEIGPGLGSLTLALLDQVDHLIAIEIDTRLANQLPLTIKGRGLAAERLTVINADAVKLKELPKNPTVLVANLPYNVSVPVLLKILENFPTITHGVVMVQSEVAQRLAAKAGNKEYGSPTVKANWWASLKIAAVVSRSVFWPTPNVDSSLVRFDRHLPAGSEAERIATFEVIDLAFAKRRKMLRSALAKLFKTDLQLALTKAGVDPTIRGEVLEVADFLKIGKQLINEKSTK